MSRSRILGPMGTDNYRVSDCPFHLPKENVKFFHSMQDAASQDPYNNFKQYGNAYSPEWRKSLEKRIAKAIKEAIDNAFNDELNS